MELVSVNSLQNNQQLERLPPLPGQIDKSRELGGRYTLANNAITHSVPPIGAIKSNGEHQSGVIDTWPAHSTNQRPSNMQLSLNKFNNLVLTNANSEGKPDNAPKPKFLENLEKFVHRELKALGCAHGHGTNEVRLQAYREAFEYLLEEFKTYKPILSMIKNEYEMMLSLQREKIRELEPLKQMLVTLADQCDYKLMQYREEEKNDIKQLKEDKKRQMDKILELKNGNHTLQVQVEKLQSEVSKEHERFRNEQDKRKLLILDLNDLRFQQEEAKLAEMKREKKRMAQGIPEEEESEEDPVTLKIALRVCRQNLNDAMVKLTKMEADYGDVVPRRDYEQLKTLYEALQENHSTMEAEFTQNKNDLAAIEKKAEVIGGRNTDVERQLEEYRRDCTPRPDWERCTSLIDAEKWNNLIVDKTSVQILEHFVYELGGKKDGNGPKMTEYHTAMGLEMEVPAHLRTDGSRGQVKKISLSKRDMCLIVKDFWKQREGQTGDISDFLIKFLRKRYNTDMQAFEYSYAMHEALDSGKLDNEMLSQFSAILSGKLDEDAFYNEQKVFKKLLETLKEAQKAEKFENDTVSREGFGEALKSLFKYVSKSKPDYKEVLMKAVDEELAGIEATSPDRIDYKLLFIEDFKDKHGHFINALRAYTREERQLFSTKMKEHAGMKNELTLNDLKLAANQEQVPIKDVDGLIGWIFQSEKTVDGETFSKRIESCGYYPSL